MSNIHLENFAEFDQDAKEESSEFKRGFAEGFGQSKASQLANQCEALGNIASTLNDMSFGYEEARLHIMSQLGPLLNQVAQSILPSVMQDIFVAHIVEEIERRFEPSTENQIQISVSPSFNSTLRDNYTEANSRFAFVADSSLDDGQALIKSNEIHLLMDLPTLIGELQDALGGIENISKENSNGQ